MVLGNLVGKTPKQVLQNAVALDLSSRPKAVVTVQILADVVADFSYRNDKNAVSLSGISLIAGTWLYGIKSFNQSSGISVCYIN